MLSFNMEDVLFSLVFQYLLSGSFLLPELRYVPMFAPGPVGSGYIRIRILCEKFTINVPLVYMARDLMILMLADALQGQVGGG